MELNDGLCIPICPERYYSSYFDYKRKPEQAEELELNLNQCLACHYTCRHCNGSNDYECTECFPDAVLFQTSTSEYYCYPSNIVSDVLSEKWYFRMFLILCILLVVLVAFTAWKFFQKKKKRDFISLDTLKNIRNIERDVKNSVYSDSD